MRRTPISYYSYGIDTVLADGNIKKVATATECAKQAIAEGHSFIMGYTDKGDQVVFALNKDVLVLSKEEALRRYFCDGDKRTLISTSGAKIWIVAPVVGFSDIVIPFSGRIRSFRALKPEDIL